MPRLLASRRRLAAVVVLVVATGCEVQPRMSAEDARTFSLRALRHIGLRQVEVERAVTPGRYQIRPRSRLIEVWITRSQVSGGTVVLYVPRRGDRAVYVSDVGEGGTQLLTERQFDALARFRLNPSLERRRPWVIGAAVLAGLVAVALAAAVLTAVTDRRRRAPAPEGEGGPRRRRRRRGREERAAEEEPPSRDGDRPLEGTPDQAPAAPPREETSQRAEQEEQAERAEV